jgi:minichromosome maintenance protein 10
MDRQAAQNIVQVPASPVKRSNTAPDLNTSPQRVLLGIDKGRKAADMSLKRAPIHRKSNEERSGLQGGFLRRAKSPLGGPGQEHPRPLSFNERLASARTEETARQERRERVERSRTTAFSVGKEEMEDYKSKALNLPDLPSRPQEFSREQILSAVGKTSGGQLHRSNTVPTIRSGTQSEATDSFAPSSAPSAGNADLEASIESYSGLQLSKRILPHRALARAVSGKKSYVLKDLLQHVKAPDWCLPDDESDIVVFAIVASKSEPRSHRPGPGGDGKDRGKYMVLTLVDLTYEVELFLFNSGFDRFWKLTPGTVLAILNPGILPPPPGREATNRFGLVINSDEDTILEIGNARDIGYCKSIKKDGTYCKSWINAKRTEYCEFHTNEAVRKARSGRVEMSSTAGFGASDGARGRNRSRLGFAKSEADRKHGNYDRATQSQYFISTAHRATDPDDERITGIADRREREEALKRRLAQREKERDIARRLGELGGGAGKEYMTRTARTTTTKPNPPRAGGSSFTTTATSSSFSSATSTGPTTSLNTSLATTLPSSSAEQLSGPPGPRWDARALGLAGRRGADGPKVELGRAPGAGAGLGLGPSKRKRPESSHSSSTASGIGAVTGGVGKVALGWGSVLKDKLGRMKEGERFDGRTIVNNDRGGGGNTFGGNGVTGSGGGIAAGGGAFRGERSPVRKKTRFVTEKGIREAGRESLGELLSVGVGGKGRRQVVLDDDDDDLIIVK